MRCPYCNKPNCVPEVMFIWVENYGHAGMNGGKPRCVHCDKVLDVTMKKVVELVSIKKAPKNATPDW